MIYAIPSRINDRSSKRLRIATTANGNTEEQAKQKTNDKRNVANFIASLLHGSLCPFVCPLSPCSSCATQTLLHHLPNPVGAMQAMHPAGACIACKKQGGLGNVGWHPSDRRPDKMQLNTSK